MFVLSYGTCYCFKIHCYYAWFQCLCFHVALTETAKLGGFSFFLLFTISSSFLSSIYSFLYTPSWPIYHKTY